MKSNIFFEKILKLGKVKFNKSNLENLILNDFNRHNFLGIISILKQFNIKTEACKINLKEDVFEIKLPFIAHLNGPEEIVIVESVSEGKVYYTNIDGYTLTSNLDDFSYRVTNNLILLDFKNSYENNYWLNLILENLQKFLFFLILILIVFINLIYNNSIENYLYLINNLIGLYVSYKLHLIVLNQDQENSKICNFSKKTNCLNVINHRLAKLFGIIPYDKIGIIYFLFSLISITFSKVIINNEVLLLLFGISSFFPIYSIYFQYFIVKKWCPLCLIIQLNIISNFIIIYINYSIFEIDIFDILINFVILTLITLIVYLFSIYSLNKSEILRLQKKVNLFLSDTEVFNLIDKRNIDYIKIPENMRLYTGNLDSSEVITLITNPLCQYCSEKYFQIKKVLEYNENIKLETIYCIPHQPEIMNEVTRELINIYLNKGPENYEKKVSEWYLKGKDDFNKWLVQNKSKNDNSATNDILMTHSEWCELSKITYTPAILINGKNIPKGFDLIDFSYLL